MDHSWALRGHLGRPANSFRALCPGTLPPKESFYQFPVQAEVCFHEVQGGNSATCLNIIWELACYHFIITAAFMVNLLSFSQLFVLSP